MFQTNQWTAVRLSLHVIMFPNLHTFYRQYIKYQVPPAQICGRPQMLTMEAYFIFVQVQIN